MGEEPVVFTSTVEGLTRALDARVHAQFAPIGLPGPRRTTAGSRFS